MIGDSFNDGRFYAGVLTAQTDLVTLIKEYRKLDVVPRKSRGNFRGVFPDVTLPESEDAYSDYRGSFVADPDGRRVYFWAVIGGKAQADGSYRSSAKSLPNPSQKNSTSLATDAHR